MYKFYKYHNRIKYATWDAILNFLGMPHVGRQIDKIPMFAIR